MDQHDGLCFLSLDGLSDPREPWKQRGRKVWKRDRKRPHLGSPEGHSHVSSRGGRHGERLGKVSEVWGQSAAWELR